MTREKWPIFAVDPATGSYVLEYKAGAERFDCFREDSAGRFYAPVLPFEDDLFCVPFNTTVRQASAIARTDKGFFVAIGWRFATGWNLACKDVNNWRSAA